MLSVLKQWGIVNSAATVIFPLAFPTAVYAIYMSTKSASANNAPGADIWMPTGITLKGFRAGSISYQWNSYVFYYLSFGK